MTCYEIVSGQVDPLPEIAWCPLVPNVIGHVCSDGPHRELKREPAGVKWCFSCRKHLPHDFVAFGPTEPSYYGPWCRYDCSRCHQDHTVGFGMVREWDVG